MAIETRARVELEPNDTSTWIIEGLGHVDRREAHLSELVLQDPTGDLLSAVVQTVHANRIPLPRGAWVRVDTSEFDTSVGDGGLGSSAATAVALTAACTGPRLRKTIAGFASEAHRRFQNNLGSGYDVGCSAYGGLLVIRGIGDMAIKSIDWPSTLSIWLATDHSYTNTASMVRKVVELNKTVQAVQWHVSALGRLAEKAVSAAKQKDAELLVALMRQFCLEERELGETTDQVIVTDALLRLDDTLQPLGAVCKPSGAGGDELVVIVGPKEAGAKIQRCIEASGFSLIEMSRAEQGFRFESTGR